MNQHESTAVTHVREDRTRFFFPRCVGYRSIDGPLLLNIFINNNQSRSIAVHEHHSPEHTAPPFPAWATRTPKDRVAACVQRGGTVARDPPACARPHTAGVLHVHTLKLPRLAMKRIERGLLRPQKGARDQTLTGRRTSHEVGKCRATPPIRPQPTAPLARGLKKASADERASHPFPCQRQSVR